MSMLPVQVGKYLDSRGITGPWSIAALDRGDFDGAVVIPSLAESNCLFATLDSLAQNPPDLLSRFLVLVVVNHRVDAVPEDKTDNYRTMRSLAAGAASFAPLRLAWVDAASAGKELPAKGGGVGLSRKIGFDLALPRLSYEQGDPLLIALDADTIVRPDYLPALVSHFRTTEAGGAVIPFRHREDGMLRQRHAIRRYELFLRSYVLGLSLAGSPYAFHSVGSAMACSAGAYVRAGGMNSRVAGEDFYFLQQLYRTSAIAQVRGTVVYPSARVSHRVPFGTGRSVARLLAEEEGAVLFYQPECFHVLGKWLSHIGGNIDDKGEDLLAGTEAISPHLREYLEGIRFAEVWGKLCRTSREHKRRLSAFHDWFDGLKTMKLIHHLSAGPYPRCEPGGILPRFFRGAGLEPVEGTDRQLALLRRIQTGEGC
jgi:hypothetical protein